MEGGRGLTVPVDTVQLVKQIPYIVSSVESNYESIVQKFNPKRELWIAV
jgi:hypothetical protein